MTDGNDKRRKGDEIDPDAPPTEEEILASQRLRDALQTSSAAADDQDLELVRSLRAAWSPGPLDERAHAEILDDMPLSAEEIALAARLRDALEAAPGKRPAANDRNDPNDAGSELVTALRSAWNPAPLDDAEHRAMVDEALGRGRRGDGSGSVIALRPRAPAMRLAFVTTTTVLALAASVIVWITSTPPSETPLARARSTQPLFDEPFKAGETSARIDKIAIARASDYRDNRFAKWGVR